MKRTFAFLVVVLLVSAGEGYGAKPPKRLGVRVDGDRIEVQRAETGGAVLVVGDERRTRAGAPHFRRVEAEVSAGADGTASLQLRKKR